MQFCLILANCFALWFKPDPAQAGSQKYRGCVEQIATLRLLIDYAVWAKKQFFIVFIDFEKAYDKVDRQILLNVLHEIGCSKIFMTVIKNSLSTLNQIGNEEFRSFMGVRQGCGTSCSLFNLHVDVTF